jgi:GTPase
MQVGPKEIEEGNVEYKRYLHNLTDSKLNHLSAQMNWRINEGNGICNYYLGVCDDGTIYKDFSQEQIEYTLDMIKIMVGICNSYIETIIINRYKEYFWLNVIIKRKKEYLREYRILVLTNIIKPIFNELGLDYKSNKSVYNNYNAYYNTYIHNNDKYLFFEVSKKKTNKLLTLVDFNLIINEHFSNIESLLEYTENNMTSNKESIDNYIIFNIINNIYIPSIGTILFGFLKQGIIKVGDDIILNEKKYNILSIHNNMIDCNKAQGPSTISIRVMV